jgi:hypothetical protein
VERASSELASPRTGVKEIGSSSLLVMMFDRSYRSKKVFQRDDRKMLQPHNWLEHKDISAAFTKSDEDPGNYGENPIPLCGRRKGRTWMF